MIGEDGLEIHPKQQAEIKCHHKNPFYAFTSPSDQIFSFLICFLNFFDQFREFAVLGQLIKSAHLNPLFCCGLGLVAGEHDHFRLQPHLLEYFQHFKAIRMVEKIMFMDND
jgi:hypothetical protein